MFTLLDYRIDFQIYGFVIAASVSSCPFLIEKLARYRGITIPLRQKKQLPPQIFGRLQHPPKCLKAKKAKKAIWLTFHAS